VSRFSTVPSLLVTMPVIARASLSTSTQIFCSNRISSAWVIQALEEHPAGATCRNP
jgi:hypothetical protein